MVIEKYVLLFEAHDDSNQVHRDAAADQLVANARSAPTCLVGLTVGTVIEVLTGPARALAVAQLWIDTTAGSADDVLASVTGLVEANVSTWLTDEIVFLAPTERAAVTDHHSRINLFGTAAKREDFSTEAFFDYWKATHAPISATVPGITGYVVSKVERTVDNAYDRTVDAFIELWWPSHDSFVAAGSSPAQTAAWEDVPNYARTDGHFWLTREHVAIPPPATGPGLLDRTQR